MEPSHFLVHLPPPVADGRDKNLAGQQLSPAVAAFSVTAMRIASFESAVSHYREFFGADEELTLSLPRFSCGKTLPPDFFEGVE